MTSLLPAALVIAGLLHFSLLLAGLSAPQVLDWRRELRKVDPLTRQLVWVHGAFIVLTIISFGAITLLAGSALLDGSVLSLSVTTAIGIFWSCRLVLQLFYFNAGPWLRTTFLRLGYRALYGVFAYLSVVYLMATWVNGLAYLQFGP